MTSTPRPEAPDPAAQGSAASSPRIEHRIVVPPSVPMVAVLGSRDSVLRAVEDGFPSVDVHARGNEIAVAGGPGEVALVSRLLDELVEIAESGTPLTPDVVRRSIGMLTAPTASRPADVLTFNILSSRGRQIRPKTVGQKRYVDAIDANTITFGIGPAGTGKTYLAMAKAVQALQAKQVDRIVLTRPAVEAGERLGFLPGSLSEKIDPYLRPLYDALHDMVDPDSIPRLIDNGTVEVAPLAYMRGRTLNSAFIVLDEAQNTSAEQMKMFLTRLGFGSKMVITGDVTQVDLPGGTTSGLRVIEDVLTGVEDVEFCRLTSSDVVRHRLVSDIIDAYARWDVASGAGQRRHDRRDDRPGRDNRGARA
ncbi:PhoH family protein [Luteimicrobium sp. DT211]|uniref:PhoH family protein n=1 Tax=Luteimicrobium sp. DT211 TaxID=3393412 RepID=UPI003CFB24A5